MHPALPDAVRDPHQCLTGWLQAVRELSAAGVKIEYAQMSTKCLGEWDSATGTLLIRETASLAHQVWFLSQAWLHINVGPAATPAARLLPTLRAVPAPRAAIDEPPA